MKIRRCYFYIHQYIGNVHCVSVRNDEDVRVFSPLVEGKPDVDALYGFTFELLGALEGGYTLISADSLAYGLRYVTENIPEPSDGLLLVFNHIDIAFSTLMMTGEASLILPKITKDLDGALNRLSWLSDVVEGRVTANVSTGWSEHLMERYGINANLPADSHAQAFMATVGSYFPAIANSSTMGLPKWNRVITHISWLFAHKDVFDAAIEKQKKFSSD